MIKEITSEFLIHLFLKEDIKGCTFISMDTETIQSLTGGKKNPMKGNVIKRSKGHNLALFTNNNSNGYENMVNKRLIAEGKDPETFELQPRTWGERIENTPLILHKNQYYLEVIFIKSGNVDYLYNGNEIKKNDIEGFPTPKTPSGQGGLNKQVQIRTFKIDSITHIKMNKNHYKISK